MAQPNHPIRPVPQPYQPMAPVPLPTQPAQRTVQPNTSNVIPMDSAARAKLIELRTKYLEHVTTLRKQIEEKKKMTDPSRTDILEKLQQQEQRLKIFVCVVMY